MHILRFDDDRIGVLRRGEVVDVSDLITHREYRGAQGAMEELIESFDRYRPRIDSMLASAPSTPLDAVVLRSPLARPSRVLAAFVNYWNKPERGERNVLEFFHKSPHLVGPGGALHLPDIESVVEFQPEAELGVVIGRKGRGVLQQDAMDYVFGYVPYVDLSARGMTRRSQFLPKGQDGFSACGPWITTRDEVADPQKLQIRSWVNGEPRQDFSTSHMMYHVDEQLAWLTRFIELRPGDLIATGGFHAGLREVNVGDVFDIEIEGLGRATFNVNGDSPLKKADFKPGGGAGLNMTRV